MEKWKKILLKMNFWTISVFVITSLVVVSHVHAFSITSAEVSGDGKEESRPAKESKVANVVAVIVKATRGQFHQRVYKQLLRSKILKVASFDCVFALLGSACIKAGRKMLVLSANERTSAQYLFTAKYAI